MEFKKIDEETLEETHTTQIKKETLLRDKAKTEENLQRINDLLDLFK